MLKNKWSMDIFKKCFHTVEKIIVKTSWKFTCYKCTGEWVMSDKDGIEPIFNREFISCPHCRSKAKVIDK